MPTVYENEGHRRRSIATAHRTAFKYREMMRDPHCRECAKLMYHGQNHGRKAQATVDHILSRGLGGTDTEENFRLICNGCNNRKSKRENAAGKKLREGKITQAEVLSLTMPQTFARLPHSIVLGSV